MAEKEPVQNRRRDVATEECAPRSAMEVQEFKHFCNRIGERAAARGLPEEMLAELLEDGT